MEDDELGFLYPEIDEVKCIKCGLCKKVCSFNSNYDRSANFAEPKVYAVQHKDKNEIELSQSGAAFVAISDYILHNKGIVYEAGFEEHFKVTHKRALTQDERDEFRGSKYVQSNLNNVFKQIKADLLDGKYVMFTGTPCQTVALKSFLKLSNINIKNFML